MTQEANKLIEDMKNTAKAIERRTDIIIDILKDFQDYLDNIKKLCKEQGAEELGNNLQAGEQQYYEDAPCLECGKPNAMTLIEEWQCKHCLEETQNDTDDILEASNGQY